MTEAEILLKLNEMVEKNHGPILAPGTYLRGSPDAEYFYQKPVYQKSYSTRKVSLGGK